MLVLTEAFDQLPPSTGQRDLQIASDMAQLMGFPVYSIPPDCSRCETADNALAHIPVAEQPTAALWLGYIPTPDRYKAIYTAAEGKNWHLLNTPQQHLLLQEFDRAYPALVELTPASVVVNHPDQCAAAAAKLGFPLFVRGAVQSCQGRGRKACVADNLEDLEHLTRVLLEDLPERSRGRVILRQWVQLHHTRTTPDGFPLGREFRIVLWGQRVVSYGFYWEGEDRDRYLTLPEEEEMFAVAFEAMRRLQEISGSDSELYAAIDIGQLVDGRWIVIETGDPQFTGLTQMPLIQFWHSLETFNNEKSAISDFGWGTLKEL